MKIKKIEKSLFKDCYELKREDGILCSTILDEELDPVDLCFNNDGCVQIKTEGLGFLTLSVRQLKNLALLIKMAEKVYENEDDED
jgi:hypothetical protein